METVMHQLSHIKPSLGRSDNNIPFESFLIFQYWLFVWKARVTREVISKFARIKIYSERDQKGFLVPVMKP